MFCCCFLFAGFILFVSVCSLLVVFFLRIMKFKSKDQSPIQLSRL